MFLRLADLETFVIDLRTKLVSQPYDLQCNVSELSPGTKSDGTFEGVC